MFSMLWGGRPIVLFANSPLAEFVSMRSAIVVISEFSHFVKFYDFLMPRDGGLDLLLSWVNRGGVLLRVARY